MKLSLLRKLLAVGVIGASLSAAAHAEDLLDTVKALGVSERLGLSRFSCLRPTPQPRGDRSFSI